MCGLQELIEKRQELMSRYRQYRKKKEEELRREQQRLAEGECVCGVHVHSVRVGCVCGGVCMCTACECVCGGG